MNEYSLAKVQLRYFRLCKYNHRDSEKLRCESLKTTDEPYFTML